MSINYVFILTRLFSYKNKDTENDASKAGRYCHPWVTLSGDCDVRKAIWKKNDYFKRFLITSINCICICFAKKRIGFKNVTSCAVAPCQQSKPQHSVAETQHHTKHVQKTNHFRGCCADQHCTDQEAQKSKQLEGGNDKNTSKRTYFIITA